MTKFNLDFTNRDNDTDTVEFTTYYELNDHIKKDVAREYSDFRINGNYVLSCYPYQTDEFLHTVDKIVYALTEVK